MFVFTCVYLLAGLWKNSQSQFGGRWYMHLRRTIRCRW